MATTAHGSTAPRKKTAKAAPAATPKPAAAKAAARKPRTNGTKAKAVGVDQRRNYIEVAAYYIAERRGFVGGSADDDWAAAEAEIDRLLLEGKLNN